MKKLLLLSVLGLFALGMVAQSAFAAGDCSGKSRSTTTTADTSLGDVDKS